MRWLFFVFATFVLCCGCIQGGDDSAKAGGITQSTVLPRDSRDDGNVTVYDDAAACETRKDKYKDLCYINTASTLKDASLCEKIQRKETKELCYGRVGVATGDPRLCDRISNPSQRGQCHLALEQMGS